MKLQGQMKEMKETTVAALPTQSAVVQLQGQMKEMKEQLQHIRPTGEAGAGGDAPQVPCLSFHLVPLCCPRCLLNFNVLVLVRARESDLCASINSSTPCLPDNLHLHEYFLVVC